MRILTTIVALLLAVANLQAQVNMKENVVFTSCVFSVLAKPYNKLNEICVACHNNLNIKIWPQYGESALASP